MHQLNKPRDVRLRSDHRAARAGYIPDEFLPRRSGSDDLASQSIFPDGCFATSSRILTVWARLRRGHLDECARLADRHVQVLLSATVLGRDAQ